MGAQAHTYLTRLVSLLLSTVAPVVGANAQDYGKVGAVNLDATATPPGGATRSLKVGSNVVYKERIVTSARGSTQILFPDQSTLNVGSNSNLVLDEFYYDPNARTGNMTATVTKGVLRYIGGQISHTTGVTINTPVASLGIRGGIATIMLPVPASLTRLEPRLAGMSGQLVVSHFGIITVSNGANQVNVRQGYAVIVNDKNEPITAPFRPTDAFLAQLSFSLMSKPGQNGGVGNAGVPTEGNTAGLFGTPNSNPFFVPRGAPLDPLGFRSIFNAGNDAARYSRPQTPPPYP